MASRPCDTGKVLHAYFKALIAYAKHALERRPGQVVSMNLPNPESIDAWFEQFRAYKRNIGVKNVSVAQEYPKREPLPDFDARFDQAFRAHQRALAESDEEEDMSPSDEEDGVDDDEIYVIETRPRPNEGPATRSHTRQSAGSSTGARSEPMVETINSRLSSMRVQQQPDQNSRGHGSIQGHTAPAYDAELYYQMQHAHMLMQQEQQLQRRLATHVQLLRLLSTGGQAAIFLARLPLDNKSLIVFKVFFSPPSQHEMAGMRAMALSAFTIRLIGETTITYDALLPFVDQLRQYRHDLNSFQFDGYNCVMGWCYERLQGDLESVILDRKERARINNTMKMLIGLQIAYFLRGMHTAGFIFRDLKPSNVLVCKDLGVDMPQVLQYFVEHELVIKVTDFGLVTRSRAGLKTPGQGTIGYMPAAQMTNAYDASVDVVALGITLTELLTDAILYPMDEPDATVKHEFETLRVLDRIRARFAQSPRYIPSALQGLITDVVQGRLHTVDPVIEYLEGSLKAMAFAHGVEKRAFEHMSEDTGTPARPRPAGGGGESPCDQQRRKGRARSGLVKG
ncbi:hypothetical protein GGF32_001850 [Allomyces javanicus]|nr:hypothetical protein GGF32_001850 [Allomyces javanicus]